MAIKDKGSQWDRADNYRPEFLKHNKGLFGCLYFCAYCGKPITRKNMQVDHHIAVNRVKKNPLYKIYLGTVNTFLNAGKRIACFISGTKFKKSTGVNVTYNLIPACAKCNNAKKDKGGTWVIRGAIGGTIWKVVNAVNNVILWALSKPIVQGAILCLLGIAVFQYFMLGTGVMASIVAFFHGIGAAIGGFFAAFFAGFL